MKADVAALTAGPECLLNLGLPSSDKMNQMTASSPTRSLADLNCLNTSPGDTFAKVELIDLKSFWLAVSIVIASAASGIERKLLEGQHAQFSDRRYPSSHLGS